MRNNAFVHLAAFAGGIADCFFPLFFSIWAPLAVWLLSSKGPEQDWHGREAVRFQVVMLMYSIALLAGMLVLALFFPIAPLLLPDAWSIFAAFGAAGVVSVPLLAILALTILSIVVPLVAAAKARQGERYVYPFTFSPRRHTSHTTVV